LQEISGFKLPPLPPATWTRDVLSGDVCSQSEATLIICGAWSLWTGRNARNHDKRSMNAGVAARHVARMVEDVICLKYDNMVSLGRQPRESRWRRPDPGWVKVNILIHLSFAHRLWKPQGLSSVMKKGG
jgi:hypothetical protein